MVSAESGHPLWVCQADIHVGKGVDKLYEQYPWAANKFFAPRKILTGKFEVSTIDWGENVNFTILGKFEVWRLADNQIKLWERKISVQKAANFFCFFCFSKMHQFSRVTKVESGQTIQM